MPRPTPLHRALALAILLAGVTATTAWPAAAGAATGCSATRERQVLHVTLPWRYRLVTSSVVNGQQRLTTLVDTTQTFGRIDIAGATCKRPAAAWRVIDPIAIGYRSTGLDPAGNLRASGLMRGWGIGIRSGAGGSAPRFSLQVMHCGRGNFFGALKEVLGVPLPWKLPVGVGFWAVSHFLPADKIACGDVGVQAFRVIASSTGLLRIVDVGRHDLREVEVDQGAAGHPSTIRSYLVRPIAVTRV